MFYNAIDEDDKHQLTPTSDYIEEDFPFSKRQKLNVNYSIGPFVEQTHYQQLQHHQGRKKLQVVNRISSI